VHALPAINLYVGLTDLDWFEFLSRQALDEINFWQPSGRTMFRALRPGELFLFKLHSPNNFIVGGGIFAHASILPVSIAWDTFGIANGASSLAQMRARTARYRREPVDPHNDYSIGCRLLEQPFFFDRKDWIPVPASWASNTQVGRRYDTDTEDGRLLWGSVQDRMARQLQGLAEGERFGEPVLIRPRLGQGTFRVKVTDNYERRCAVTGEKTLPILDAAHIHSYREGGPHSPDNGLLLRTDIHRLFDLGYVTVSTAGHFEVGKRLKDDFDNGRLYYGLHGKQLWLPRAQESRPSRAALEWHQTKRFLG
jgi:putative restriction endonuclease